MAHMNYVFGDALTGQILAEIACFGVYITQSFGDGSFQGTFNFDQTGQDNNTLAAATAPGRSFCVVERDGKPVWGGIITSRTYQSQAKVAELYGSVLENYPKRRVLRSNYKRTNVEQQNIVRELYRMMQADPNSIRVNIPADTGDLQKKSIDVLASEYKTYRELIDNIADGDDGFDWRIDWSRSNNVYVKQMVIGYPTLGAKTAGNLVFEYPGSITNYWDAQSMGGGGTHLYGVGAGEGDTMVVGEEVHTTLLASGFPRYDIVIDEKGVNSKAILASIMRQQKYLRKPPIPVITAEVKGDMDPVFGSYQLGDEVSLQIYGPQYSKSPSNPYGLFVRNTRVLGWEYYPPQADTVEYARLTFEGDNLG